MLSGATQSIKQFFWGGVLRILTGEDFYPPSNPGKLKLFLGYYFSDTKLAHIFL